MPTLRYAGRDLAVQQGESVLDCLLRHDIAISHSCKAGACQSCLVKGSEGPVSEVSQRGLKDTLRAQGYFLACSHRPNADITVSPVGTEARTQAQITGRSLLNESVLRVRLRPEAPFSYFAGQFVSLFREDGLARSYSLASLPNDQEIELHVRRVMGGAMSEWLHQHAITSTSVWLQGPSGNCFYVPGNTEEPLVLVGAGTGLAPLYGIVKDALLQGHTGPIWLFHGALNPTGLYLTSELRELAEAHSNFHYIRSVLRDADPGEFEVGPLEQCLLAKIPKFAGWKGYVCGDPALVNSIRKKLFLAGMASKSIYADSFVPSAPSASCNSPSTPITP